MAGHRALGAQNHLPAMMNYCGALGNYHARKPLPVVHEHLSFVLLFIKEMAVFVEQKPKIHAQRPSGASHSTGPQDVVPAAPVSADPRAGADSPDGELPDIVSIVMAMDHAPGDEPAEAPSPALPTSGGQTRVPAHLEKLADRARDYVEAASAANTRCAYAADWKHFASWCRRQGVEMFPPDPQGDR